MKIFMVSVPDEICNIYVEDFIIQKLHIELAATGCGSTEFTSKLKPRRFEQRLLKRFGTCLLENIQYGRYIDEYDDNSGETNNENQI